MLTSSRVPPSAVHLLARVREAVYGPRYRSVRREAFARSGGTCQFCGLRPAAEAHHWALRYPRDAEITADDLIALCRSCHGVATLRRVMDRRQAGVWFILALAAPLVGRRKRISRARPRGCCPSPKSTPSSSVPPAPVLVLRMLVERCHLLLVVGCVACQRYVRLDTISSLPAGWRSMSVTQLRRRLSCCRCRSRARWVLLGGWPQVGTGGTHEGEAD